ncbi:hypothetical protein F2Q69_00027911 [Brassica cretica]|uniref:Uncharacterized protein n=1 Tax=Brassica cretica TaxID=69181 RepID=A0A8S9S0X9_BRACR|nr:hypothetical protein F2Q69_00027911 [Brassica cretica]
MRNDHEMHLIFGRSFMATVGAIIDMPSKRVSFSNINKKVFYKAVPTISQIRYASYISVVSGEQLEIVPKKELGKKGEIKEVLDRDPHIDTKKLSGNFKSVFMIEPVKTLWELGPYSVLITNHLVL